MTIRYLLDSNILSAALKEPWSPLSERLRRHADKVCTSIIVAAELRFGAAKKGSARITALIDQLLERIEVLPFTSPADEVYGILRADLARRGCPIGQMDELIAAHALAEGCILVTDNEREFSRVEGLKVENWLREA